MTYLLKQKVSFNQKRTDLINLPKLNKNFVKAAASITRPRDLVPALDPRALCFYDAAKYPGVKGRVALTIDDAPCHQPACENKSMLSEVRDLLAEFNARATFFLCTDYVPGHELDLITLLRDGHEVANHCGADRSYSGDSEEDFEAAFLKSEAICEDLRHAAAAKTPSSRQEGSGTDEPAVLGRARWFRAPHADMGPSMQQVINRHGFTNVLCDSFANDTVIIDSAFIASTLLSLIDGDGGSIIVVHTPEYGFRQHNFDALRMLLIGLRKQGLRAVTVSDLHEAAQQGKNAGVEDFASEPPPKDANSFI